MKLTVLGTGPSFPNPGGASAGYLIEERDTRLLVDCGHGVAARLFTVLDPPALTAIIISHMHADHIFDLVPLGYAYRFRWPELAPVPVLLPPGGRQTLDRLRAALEMGESFFGSEFELSEYDPERQDEVGSLCIRFTRSNHFVPTFAMHFSPDGHDGPSVGYSSDTGFSDSVARLLRYVDLALVEATELRYPLEETAHGHLTAALAGELARDAGVGRLLLTHYPSTISDQLVAEAAAAFGRPVELAREGQTYFV